MEAVWDSGAGGVSVADSSLINNADIDVNNKILVSSASGDFLKVLGTAVVDIACNSNVSIKQKVVVVENFPFKLLLGTDYMENYKGHINFENHKVSIKHLGSKFRWPFIRVHSGRAVGEKFLHLIDPEAVRQFDTVKPRKVVIEGDIVLEPNFCHFIPVKVNNSNKLGSYVLEPSFSLLFRANVSVVPAFVGEGEDVKGLWISNYSHRSVKLLAGTAVGHLLPAERAEPEKVLALQNKSDMEFDICPDLSENQREQFKGLLDEFRDVLPYCSETL